MKQLLQEMLNFLGLYEFFSARSVEDTKEVVSQSIAQIDKVIEWFAAQRSFHFFASSLLFVYEMDETKLPNMSVSMIGTVKLFFDLYKVDEFQTSRMCFQPKVTQTKIMSMV